VKDGSCCCCLVVAVDGIRSSHGLYLPQLVANDGVLWGVHRVAGFVWVSCCVRSVLGNANPNQAEQG
jgi:hypothetical protein